jgi:Nuclease-related domain
MMRWALLVLATGALVGAMVSWRGALAAHSLSAGPVVLSVVCIVALIAATLAPTEAPPAEPTAPAGSDWATSGIGTRRVGTVRPPSAPMGLERAPWIRAAPGALLAGQQAEMAMRDYLVGCLPAGCWVLSGLVLPGLSGDIDLLVVGALGGVVLEVKYWAGRIVCGAGGHTWARERRGQVESLDDPAGQLEGEIRPFRAFLQRRGCPVLHGVGGMLVFAHPRCLLEVAACPVVAVRPDLVLDILHCPTAAPC